MAGRRSQDVAQLLVELAAGTGIASLAAGADGVVRTLPLLAAEGESARIVHAALTHDRPAVGRDLWR